MLEHLHDTSFDWLTWAGGSLIDLGIMYNKIHILRMRQTIKKYAVGFEDGNKVLCRPKRGCIAVMFFKDKKFFWTHLKLDEFSIIFPEEIKSLK